MKSLALRDRRPTSFRAATAAHSQTLQVSSLSLVGTSLLPRCDGRGTRRDPGAVSSPGLRAFAQKLLSSQDRFSALRYALKALRRRRRRKKTTFPQGWNEERVRRVLEHYDAQSDEEALAEDKAAYESTTHTSMEIPVDLVPQARELL